MLRQMRASVLMVHNINTEDERLYTVKHAHRWCWHKCHRCFQKKLDDSPVVAGEDEFKSWWFSEFVLMLILGRLGASLGPSCGPMARFEPDPVDTAFSRE